MTPLLPQPIADEHALSLLHAYLELNGCPVLSLFGYSRGIYLNSEHNVRYAKIAELFAETTPVDEFLVRHGFSRLETSLPVTVKRRNAPVSALASSLVLRFCPECRRNDIATQGYARWRRTHQVCGVEVCPDHGCSILMGCAGCGYAPGTTNSVEGGRGDCPHCGIEYTVIYPDRSIAMRLMAQFYQAVLAGAIPARALVHLPEVLKELAQAKFGVSGRGIAARLRHEIELAFPPTFLADLDFDPRHGAGAGWIRYFCAGLKFTDALQAHALIGAVVFSSIQEWIEVYGAVSRQHLVHRPVRIYHQIPLSAALLTDLAWQSSLIGISEAHYVTERDLRWVIENVPGLQRVRSTSLIQRKRSVLKGKIPGVRTRQASKSTQCVMATIYREEEAERTATALLKALKRRSLDSHQEVLIPA